MTTKKTFCNYRVESMRGNGKKSYKCTRCGRLTPHMAGSPPQTICHTRPGKTKRSTESPSASGDTFNVYDHINSVPYHELSHNIAAITCYFNPQQSMSRRKCFANFSSQFPKIGMDLYTAEGSGSGNWEIRDNKFLSRFELDPESCLFAKENLLNLLTERLPDSIEYVLWIDCDVLLLASDYTQRLAGELSRHSFVQGFRQLTYIDQDGHHVTGWRNSIAKANIESGQNHACPRLAYPGLAWAASRDTLHKVGGLYDRCVTGGGDVAFTIALYQDKEVPYTKSWSGALIDAVLKYSDRFTDIGTAGFVESDGIHMYHGNLASRQYIKRNAILSQLDFNPDSHLEYADNGTIKWTDMAPAQLKRGIKEYMLGRREDG